MGRQGPSLGALGESIPGLSRFLEAPALPVGSVLLVCPSLGASTQGRISFAASASPASSPWDLTGSTGVTPGCPTSRSPA